VSQTRDQRFKKIYIFAKKLAKMAFLTQNKAMQIAQKFDHI
jgi:hypothetical protein